MRRFLKEGKGPESKLSFLSIVDSSWTTELGGFPPCSYLHFSPVVVIEVVVMKARAVTITSSYRGPDVYGGTFSA